MYRLLLVEDSALIRDVIVEMLHDCDQLDVKDIATTSDEAIDLLNARQYDMIVLDIELAKGTVLMWCAIRASKTTHLKRRTLSCSLTTAIATTATWHTTWAWNTSLINPCSLTSAWT